MSQFGIDSFALAFFKNYKGIFLETGSSHPTDQNNTYNLERAGWSGILIEPRKEHNEEYEKLRPNSIVENYALVGKDFKDETIKANAHEWGHMYNITGIWEGQTTVDWEVSTLDKILKKHNITNIDFFSLDVEGYEHEVLDGTDFDFVRFGVIVIETHDYSWNNKTDDFSYLTEKGYTHRYNLSPNHQVWVNNDLNENLKNIAIY
jgi:FkbM family methyltransferase